jgi:hypothetical protein
MDAKPIACSLTSEELLHRDKSWRKVAKFAMESREIPGGLAFVFRRDPGVEDSLRQLIQLEAECCPWMTFSLEAGQEMLRVGMTGEGDAGEMAVREMFAELGQS